MWGLGLLCNICKCFLRIDLQEASEWMLVSLLSIGD